MTPAWRPAYSNAMAAKLVQIDQGLHAQTQPLPRFINHLALGAGSAASSTVPAKADHVRITYTAGNLYGNFSGATATVPAASVTDGTGADLILLGAEYCVVPGEVLSFINATACVVILAYTQGSVRV